MSPTATENALWAAGFLGHVALLFVLIKRRRWKDFPVFSGMIAYQATITVVLFLVSRFGSHSAYYHVYWTSAFADYAFQVALIFEIARAVLRPAKTWIQDARGSFLTWSCVGLLLATAVVYYIGPSSAKGLALWEVRGTLFNSVLSLELFLSMTTAANRLGLPWRSHVMALAQGISALAVADVLSDVSRMNYGWTQGSWLMQVSAFAYFASLLYWIYAFWQPERAREPLSKEMQEYLLALHRRVQYDLERQNAENSL